MRISDWSSDVCSSDLHHRPDLQGPADEPGHAPDGRDIHARPADLFRDVAVDHDRNALAGAARRPGPQTGESRLMTAWSFALHIMPLLARAAILTVAATLLGFPLAAVPAPPSAPGAMATRRWVVRSARGGGWSN